MRARALAAVALALWLPACSGVSCDDLPALQAERDVARADYEALVRSGTATDEQTTAIDDAVHDVERRVFDLEQSCARF